jgi:hypothetical protein
MAPVKTPLSHRSTPTEVLAKVVGLGDDRTILSGDVVAVFVLLAPWG